MARVLVPLAVSLVAIAVALAAFLLAPYGSPGSEGPPPPRAIITVDRTNVFTGQAVHLDGGGSTGDIVEYHWALGNGSQRSGSNITVVFGEVGRYHISLTVVDARDRIDRDFVYVRVHHREWQNESVDRAERTDTYDIEVLWRIEEEGPEQRSQGMLINLTYAAQPEVGEENNLTMSLRDPDDNVVRRHPDEWGRSGGEKYALIIVNYQETAGRDGEWDLTVEYDRGGLPPPGNSTVDYHLDITVFY